MFKSDSQNWFVRRWLQYVKFSQKKDILTFLVTGFCYLVLSALLSSNPILAVTQDDYNEELGQLRSQIEKLTEEISGSESQKAMTLDQLEALEKNLIETSASMQNLKARIDRQDDELQGLRKQKNQYLTELDANTENLETLIKAAYVLSQLKYIKVLLSENDTRRLSRTLAYYRHLTNTRSQQLDQLKAVTANLARTEHELEQGQLNLLNLVKELKSKQESFQLEIFQSQALMEELDQKVREDRAKLLAMKQKEARLVSLIKELKSADRNKEVQLDTAFSKMKGSLTRPINSKIIARFQQVKEITGTYWNGLMFAGEINQPVKSVYTGQVIFANRFQGYGKLVVIDHGEGYFSLYAYNESLEIQVGDWVETQQIISKVGQPLNQSRPGLYFELRQNGVPINPISWLKG